ncbi:MAG: cupin domain-containing protein [Pseudomonadales bacterium]|jgi:mannose-6-phosphate isomerase-like protein (cupin superfamily)|nr:cupin domain-containing protein [Pseudomonadales bacterium]
MDQHRTTVLHSDDAEDTIARLGGYRFAALFQHGSLDAGIYAPVGEDAQQPHPRDELYVIRSGQAVFVSASGTEAVTAGDVVFVAAHADHRFEAMSADFSTWVFFYGPAGGEVPVQHAKEGA